MNKTKIWLIVAAIFIIVGVFIFGGAVSMIKWDFKKLVTNQLETNNYNFNEKFQNITIITDTSDVEIIYSATDSAIVNCIENKNMKHSVSVKDDTLFIEINDTRKWYEHIGIFFGKPSITVFIPSIDYGVLSVKSGTGDVNVSENFKFEAVDISGSTGIVRMDASATGIVKVKTSTGNIELNKANAQNFDLSVSTGRVLVSDVNCENEMKIKVSTGDCELSNVKCKKLVTNGSTGDVSLNNTVAEESFYIERNTGDVKLNSCDADNEIYIETTTGHVKGSLLSNKIFNVKTDTGRINVPKSQMGGDCEIKTSTGNIKITIN